jgi:hypothetical protein
MDFSKSALAETSDIQTQRLPSTLRDSTRPDNFFVLQQSGCVSERGVEQITKRTGRSLASPRHRQVDWPRSKRPQGSALQYTTLRLDAFVTQKGKA